MVTLNQINVCQTLSLLIQMLSYVCNLQLMLDSKTCLLGKWTKLHSFQCLGIPIPVFDNSSVQQFDRKSCFLLFHFLDLVWSNLINLCLLQVVCMDHQYNFQLQKGRRYEFFISKPRLVSALTYTSWNFRWTPISKGFTSQIDCVCFRFDQSKVDGEVRIVLVDFKDMSFRACICCNLRKQWWFIREKIPC